MEEVVKILNLLVSVAKEQVIQLQKQNKLLEENNAILYKVLEKSSDRMLQKTYAKECGISVGTLIKRVREGKYDTPDGFEEPCYLLSGNQDSPIFNAKLADRYYHINNIEYKHKKLYENANQNF